MMSLNDLTKEELITLLRTRAFVSEQEISWIVWDRLTAQATQLREQCLVAQEDNPGNRASYDKADVLWKKSEAAQKKADDLYKKIMQQEKR